MFVEEGHRSFKLCACRGAVGLTGSFCTNMPMSLSMLCSPSGHTKLKGLEAQRHDIIDLVHYR